MQALTEACGETAANKHFRAWLLEYKLGSESDLDSAVCSEILEQVNRGNLSPEMMKREIFTTRQRLLGHADYGRLVVAFREVMQNRRSFKPDSHWKVSAWSKTQDDVSCISGADSQLPPIVLGLHADSLVCRDEMIVAEFQPGFKNMGFIAYAAGVDGAPNGVHVRYQKIIEGLWFFDALEK